MPYNWNIYNKPKRKKIALLNQYKECKNPELIRAIKILSKEENRCEICGGAIDLSISYPAPESAIIKYISPITQGGKYSADNMRLVHLECLDSKLREEYEDRFNIKTTIDWKHF